MMNNDNEILENYIKNEYEEISKKSYDKKDKDVILTYGTGEDEDTIIANDQGLKNLINACEKALKENNYVSKNYELDELAYSIKKVDNNYFESHDISSPSYLSNLLSFIIGILIISSFVIGFGTIVKWIFFSG